jgi:hypothetical protein
MINDSTNELTDEQKEQLQAERFIAEVLKIRNIEEKTAAQTTWERIQTFLQSSAGTAMITVIFGGVMVTVISAEFQMYSKKREIALLNLQQNIEKRHETVKSAFDLIGSSVGPADTYLRFNVAPENLPGVRRDKEDLRKQRDRMDAVDIEFEEAQRKWSGEKTKALLSLCFYFSDNEPIKDAWNDVDQAVSDYFEDVRKQCRVLEPCKDLKKRGNPNLTKATSYLSCVLEYEAAVESKSENSNPESERCRKN